MGVFLRAPSAHTTFFRAKSIWAARYQTTTEALLEFQSMGYVLTNFFEELSGAPPLKFLVVKPPWKKLYNYGVEPWWEEKILALRRAIEEVAKARG